MDLRRRQQNPASEAWLLPLTLVSFFGSLAEAAKSCLRGVSAAFGLDRFHRVFGEGSKILLTRRDCCLWTWRVSSGLRRRQQNPASEAWLLPLDLGSFFGSSAEAAKCLLTRRGCCLWTWRVSSGLRRKQQNLAYEAWVLPLTLVGFFGSSAEAAKSCLRGKIAAFDLGR